MTLLDWIIEVSAGLRRREALRAVIIPIITNGAEFTNRYARDVVAALRQAGASLHAIVIGNLTLARRRSANVRSRSTRIARTTGGRDVTLFAETAVEQGYSSWHGN